MDADKLIFELDGKKLIPGETMIRNTKTGKVQPFLSVCKPLDIIHKHRRYERLKVGALGKVFVWDMYDCEVTERVKVKTFKLNNIPCEVEEFPQDMSAFVQRYAKGERFQCWKLMKALEPPIEIPCDQAMEDYLFKMSFPVYVGVDWGKEI